MTDRWTKSGGVSGCVYLDGKLVGAMDTPELAQEIVETMNRAGALLAEVLCQAGERPRAEQPGDAERRSEATPQKDLPEDVRLHITGSPQTVIGPSRVDPYDTKKGGAVDA